MKWPWRSYEDGYRDGSHDALQAAIAEAEHERDEKVRRRLLWLWHTTQMVIDGHRRRVSMLREIARYNYGPVARGEEFSSRQKEGPYR